MTNLKNNSGVAGASNGPGCNEPKTSTSYVACILPFYPHTIAHCDVWAITDSADGRIYMVKRGNGTGFFTHSDDANLQTNGYGGSSQQSYCGWDLTCDAWEMFCESEHRGNCPPFNLTAGFAAAYPTPSRDRPATAPIPVSAPAVSYTPAYVPTPTPAPATTPTSPRTPTLANSQCVLSLASSTSTVTSSTAASPLAAPGWGSQAPPSPSPAGPPSGRPHVTPATRININPASRLPPTSFASSNVLSQAASGSAGTASAPVGPMRFWVADGLSLIFTSRANALAELRNVLMSSGSIMVSTDLDDLEAMIFGSRPNPAPTASQSGGFATCFWAVSGESRIFVDRADAVTALRQSRIASVMMMVSEDLDALEVSVDEHGA
ncbi:hypothetical protein FB451DRAFT_1161995 [Mycena latifolia]|nr:hypothetical protein FB451DRAFT_1161995 [Mycena latifolia]